jgi:Holliday junction resolvase
MAAEATLQTRIINYLNGAPDVWHTKIHNAGRGRRGIPDIIACVAGVFLAIEVKGPDGRVSPDQNREIEALNRTGANTIVARRVDDVFEVIERIRRDAAMRAHHYTYQEQTVPGTVIEL